MVLLENGITSTWRGQGCCMEEEAAGLQVLQAEIEGFLLLGSIPPRGSVMNKGMEWDKVKSF